MANEILPSTPAKTTTIRDNGEINVAKLAEDLLPTANTTFATESTEAFLFDALEKLFSRVRTLEGESNEHASVLTARLTAGCASRDEADFEVLTRVSEVKSIVSKRLYDLDPEIADTIWRAVDSIQQLIEPLATVLSDPLELTATHPM